MAGEGVVDAGDLVEEGGWALQLDWLLDRLYLLLPVLSLILPTTVRIVLFQN